MANYTIKWDETVPLGSGSKSLGDNYLRDNLTAVRERLDTEHTNVTSDTGDALLMHTWAVVAKTGDYTATAADHVILVTTAASDITITLPTAVGITGKPYKIKKVDAGAGTVIIDGNASETIDGATTLTLTNQYDFADLVSNGTNWQIISKSAVSLDWDTAWSDPVHDHSTNAEGGTLNLGGGILKFLAATTNKVDWVAATTWTDVDISADTTTDTAKAALLAVSLTFDASSAATMTALFRVNGSAETAILPRLMSKTGAFFGYGNTAGMIIVECDGSEIFEVKLQTDLGTPTSIVFKVDLIGYFC